jgi:hypothetical protein
MNPYLRSAVIALMLLQFLACSTEKQSSQGKLQGLHKYYFPDGGLYLEINYKDSVPHGLAKRYYKSGQLLEEAEYRNGIQHGITKTYHENGKLSSLIPYDSGRVHGVKKKYRKDGSPAFEAPYHYDHPCVGLTELYLSGRPVDNYPSIVIKPKNELLLSNTYTLEVSLSDKSNLVQFYEGSLVDNKYIGVHAAGIKTSKGVGKIVYILDPGEFVMKKLNVIAKVKTDLGNYYITQKSFNLAIENR